MPKIRKVKQIKSKIKIIENKKNKKEESKLEKEIEKEDIKNFVEILREGKIKISPVNPHPGN